jgi:outer membrane protein, multidrug efflux system
MIPTLFLRTTTLATACALIACLSGCGTTPSADNGPAATARITQSVAQNAPETWAADAATAAPVWPDAQWWTGVGGAELGALVDAAQQANPGARAALARVAQARALRQQALGARLPQLSLVASAQRSRDAGAQARNEISVGPALAYEVDLWGGRAAAVSARNADWRASRYDELAVRIALSAEVASLYLQSLALNDRLTLAQANVDNHQRLLNLLETQKSAGRASALDVARQQAVLSAATASLAPLRLQKRLTHDALAALLARPPQAVTPISGSLAALQVPPPRAGLPAQLLSRRPDVRRAEAALEAAHADVAVARAAIWPTLDLGLGGGWQGNTLAALSQPGAAFYSLAAQLTATLFDGGQRRARVDFETARHEELVQQYVLAAHTAWREVHDALAVIEETTDQARHEDAAVRAGREAVQLAELRLQAGAVDLSVVLDARRNLLASELSQAQAGEARLQALVLLFRALGGGWDGQLATDHVTETNTASSRG